MELEKELRKKELDAITMEVKQQRGSLEKLHSSARKLQEIGYTTEEVSCCHVKKSGTVSPT